MRGDGVCNRKIGIARLTSGDAFIPTRSLALPSRPYGKRSSSRSFRRAAACSAGAAVTLSNHASLAPVPWAPSPPRGLPLLLPRAGETVAAEDVHRLARPHAQSACPRRPSVPDRRPASAQMPGQAGHKGGAVTVGSRQTLHSSPLRSFRSRFSVCQPCRFNPSQPPKGGAITLGLRRCFESPPVPGSAS